MLYSTTEVVLTMVNFGQFENQRSLKRTKMGLEGHVVDKDTNSGGLRNNNKH